MEVIQTNKNLTIKDAREKFANSQAIAKDIVNKIQAKTRKPIVGISDHHQHIKKNTIFCAVPGENFDPRTKIDFAISKNVIAVIYESKDNFKLPLTKQKVVILPITNLDYLQGFIAHDIYSYPSTKTKILGVTGTNGKTSIIWAISSILEQLGVKSGIIGTLGYGTPNNLLKTLNTTPSAIPFNQYLNQLVNKRAKLIAVEVTSIALEQNRVQGCNFFGQTFTNLSHDHLDYHKNLANYFRSKQKLFLEYPSEFVLINLGDRYGQKLWQKRKKILTKKCWALAPINCNLNKAKQFLSKLELKQNTLPIFLVNGKNAEHFVLSILHNQKVISQEFNTNWLGMHNLENLALALINLYLSGFSLKEIAKAIQKIPMPNGRLQKVAVNKNQNHPEIYIDYAHTPDALENALKTLKTKRKDKSKLWCVFGCGGNRDLGKRIEMGKIAKKYSDIVVVTSDNPRFEEPSSILNDIYPNLNLNRRNSKIKFIVDRAHAIEFALNNANTQDLILIAGKGHEEYQDIMGKKIPFSDYQYVCQLLKQNKRKNYK